MTRQEMFDTAYKGLRAQRFVRSVDAKGSCVYRGTDGRKCALGHCIPDHLYKEGMEGNGSQRLVEEYPELAEIITDFDFATQLQMAHDSADSPDDMCERLHDLATSHDLTVPQD